MDDQDAAAYARAPEPEDLVRICRALNDAGARYVLIGGFAVLAYGASRFTKDLDLLGHLPSAGCDRSVIPATGYRTA